MNDRLANVQPRMVWPVYLNKWEPALSSVHATRTGAEAQAEHLRIQDGPFYCLLEDCLHDSSAFVGEPMEILP